MPGRESDYERGFIRGVSSMMNVITSGQVKYLDKRNILQYASEVVKQQKADNGR